MTTQEEITNIVAGVMERIARPIPIDVELWDAEHVARYFKCGARQATERYAVLPSFPKAIRLPTPTGGRGHPLWKAVEIIAWAETHREGERTGGRPRNKVV